MILVKSDVFLHSILPIPSCTYVAYRISHLSLQIQSPKLCRRPSWPSRRWFFLVFPCIEGEVFLSALFSSISDDVFVLSVKCIEMY